ncbi:nitroreductase family protein [Actinomadura harenae]|uniref:SagB/ThcOx family dehydrogenase n=1 Tax=Actinomadura harenae TaxID=2483351 RepID=A0A3M2LYA5_9ACTN|nr:hypothetical protein [Actinomadura harenae]RMI42116.1 hypothetical protein EBO15_20930 [Actinomadura harenae]
MTDTYGDATRRFLAAIDHRKPEPIDWDSAPPRYKRYRGTTRTALPTAGPQSWKDDLLRGLLGLTRVSWSYPADEAGRFLPGPRSVRVGRPVASGGALYPIEAYLADETAIHHYDTVHHALETVRGGDHRSALLPQGGTVDAALILTAVFWRNGFKYRDFAYRLQCQETGALCAQALTLADQLRLRSALHLDLDTERADTLLGLDPRAEGALAALTIATGDSAATAGTAAPVQLLTTTQAHLSTAQAVDLPVPVTRLLPHLAELHTVSGRQVAGRPLSPPTGQDPPVPGGPVIPLPPVAAVDLTHGIGRRASPLNGYQPRPITATDLTQILTSARPSGRTTTGLYVLIWNVTGIPPGAYRYDPTRLLLTGSGPAVPDQTPLAANTRHALRNATAALIPVGAPLTEATHCGDVAYRLQQTETGMVTHRAALAAAVLGLTSRIHSDAANPSTGAVLGLQGTPWRPLSFLLIGHPRTNEPALPAPAGPERGATLPVHEQEPHIKE